MEPQDAVRQMRLFSGATPADLDAVAAIAESQAYPAGERLFDTGHPPNALMYITLGMVDLRVEGKDVAFVSLSSGQVLGPVAFFEGGEQHRSAHTREATRVVRIPFDKLRQRRRHTYRAQHPHARARAIYRGRNPRANTRGCANARKYLAERLEFLTVGNQWQ